jgi:hypothetical protein
LVSTGPKTLIRLLSTDNPYIPHTKEHGKWGLPLPDICGIFGVSMGTYPQVPKLKHHLWCTVCPPHIVRELRQDAFFLYESQLPSPFLESLPSIAILDPATEITARILWLKRFCCIKFMTITLPCCHSDSP